MDDKESSDQSEPTETKDVMSRKEFIGMIAQWTLGNIALFLHFKKTSAERAEREKSLLRR